MTKEEIFKFFEEEHVVRHERFKQKDKRIQNNLKQLRKKAKELKEPIPTIVLAVILSDVFVGSWFVEKYKKWFN